MSVNQPVDISAEILEQLPIGIAVVDPGGTLRANRLGRAHASLPTDVRQSVLDGRTVRVETIPMSVAGTPTDVRITYDVTDQQALEDDLFRRAYFDDLTALPNRALIERSVDALVVSDEADTQFALAFVDLDGFKNINDYYGHAVGDALLVKIAARIGGDLGPSDMLARLGGDEFVLLLSSIGDIEALDARVQRVLARIKEPFFIEGHEIFTSASIGVCIYPADGRSYETLCANADRAMYRIKGGAKGSVQFFDSSVGNAASERMQTEQRLRLAIRDQRLGCAYQPKVDFRSNSTVGFEILLRWRDEDGLIQPPGDFVNLAVELGLMDEITHLVLAQTVDSIDAINEAFGPDSTISLNVAARQADEPVFMRSLVDAIAATGYAQRFMLELTEEAFLSKGRFQTQVLPMIREIGAKVSIDDFGVGYSSLAALADITADEIKVDRSFITNIHERPRSQSILKAIESLAQALDMSIIVEGVETVEELVYLQGATRIRLAQGFYFAKPMFLDEISRTQTVVHDLRQDAEPARVTQLRATGSGRG